MCWLLFGIILIQSAVSINAERMEISQLEKLVADLKVSHEVLLQTVSEMRFENNYFKASIKELKGKIQDMDDENQTQKKINSQLKMEITKIKTLFKSSELEELFKTKSSLLQTDKSKTVVDAAGFLKDDYKSVNTIKTNSSKLGIEQRGIEPRSSGRTSSKRLLLTDNQPVANNGVAFFAYLSKSEHNAGAHQTFVFDVDHTNIGGHYSHHTGVFTCPSHGVYVFSWSIYCNNGGYVYTELVANSSPVLGTFVGSVSVANILSSTDLAIVELNAGDEVYIRTPPNHPASGDVVSDLPYRSTFSGWKLF